jgi:hypothetical protein
MSRLPCTTDLINDLRLRYSNRIRDCVTTNSASQDRYAFSTLRREMARRLPFVTTMNEDRHIEDCFEVLFNEMRETIRLEKMGHTVHTVYVVQQPARSPKEICLENLRALYSARIQDHMNNRFNTIFGGVTFFASEERRRLGYDDYYYQEGLIKDSLMVLLNEAQENRRAAERNAARTIIAPVVIVHEVSRPAPVLRQAPRVIEGWADKVPAPRKNDKPSDIFGSIISGLR